MALGGVSDGHVNYFRDCPKIHRALATSRDKSGPLENCKLPRGRQCPGKKTCVERPWVQIPEAAKKISHKISVEVCLYNHSAVRGMSGRYASKLN